MFLSAGHATRVCLQSLRPMFAESLTSSTLWQMVASMFKFKKHSREQQLMSAQYMHFLYLWQHMRAQYIS
jgi:hypothetical protein